MSGEIFFAFQSNALQPTAFQNVATAGTFAAFLARSAELRCVLVELDYIFETSDSPPGPSSGTLYFSDREFFDDVTNHSYVDCVKAAPQYSRALSGDQLGSYISSVGSLELDNADGQLDFLLSIACDGSPIRFYLGSVNWVVADFKHIFTAIVSKVTAPAFDRISVILKDTGLLLDKRVGGTTNVGGTGPNADRARPVNIGYIHNELALVADEGLLLYVHSDSGTGTTAEEVRDRGVSVAYTDNGDGTFTLTSSPDGTITVDVLAEPAGSDKVHVSDAMDFLIGDRAGLTALGLYTGAGRTFTVDDVDDYRLGVDISDARNAIDLLADIGISGNCFWAVKRSGEFTFGRLRLNDIASFGLSEVNIYEDDIDQGSFKLDHAPPQYYKFQAYMSRNWDRQTDFASSLSPDQQAVYARPGLYVIQPDSIGTTYAQAPELYHKTLAISPVIDTLLSEVFSLSDVDSLAQWMTTRRAMFLPWIEVITITVGIEFYELELGDPVRLFIAPRMGEDDTGTLFQVISNTIRLTDAKIDLKLARRNVIQEIPPSWRQTIPVIDDSQQEYVARPQVVTPIDISADGLTNNAPGAPGAPGGISSRSKLIYVRASAGNRALTRISTFTVPKTDKLSVNTTLAAIAVSGDIHVIRYILASGATSGTYSVDAYSLAGASLGNIASSSFGTILGSASCTSVTASNTYTAFERRGGAGDQASPQVSEFLYQGSTDVASPGATGSFGTTYFFVTQAQPVYLNGYLYCVGGGGTVNSHISKWNAPSGQPTSNSPVATYAFASLTSGQAATVFTITASDDGYIYVTGPDPSNTSLDALFQLDQSLNLLHTWHSADKPTNLIRNTGFTVWGSYLISQRSIVGVWHTYLYKVNISGVWSLIQDLTTNHPAIGTESMIPLIIGGANYVLISDGVLRLV